MRVLFILLLVTSAAAHAQKSEFSTYYAKAIEAYKAKSYPEFYRLIHEANVLHPYHQGILYQLGIAAALTGRSSEAIENLQKAILIDNSFHLSGLSDFNSIKDSPGFKKLLELQQASAQVVVSTDTAFVITDKVLHAECLAYDAPAKVFFVGSIHKRKIIKVVNGKAKDFCPPAFEGMTSVFGLKADPVRNLLWACSSPMPEMENYDSTLRSAVYKFDLQTGRLLGKYQRPKFERDGVFGDLAVGKKGEAYVSDSQTNTIYIVNEKTSKLEPWLTSDEFWNMQGMTFSDDFKFMFVSDYIKGIFRIDIKTKDVLAVACRLPVSLKGIDGLCYYKGSLVAIQNGVTPLRSGRYFLNSAGTSITRYEVMDRNHPAFNEPTTGTVSGADFYYIANSQWSGYDKNHHILPEKNLQDIVVLHHRLSE